MQTCNICLHTFLHSHIYIYIHIYVHSYKHFRMLRYGTHSSYVHICMYVSIRVRVDELYCMLIHFDTSTFGFWFSVLRQWRHVCKCIKFTYKHCIENSVKNKIVKFENKLKSKAHIKHIKNE